MIETLDLPALPLLATFVAVEDAYGVRPLVETFFEGLDVGRGTLGLFTPTPDMTLEAVAVAGEVSGGDLLLRGEVRVPNPRADGAVVLVRLDSGYRLAWVEPVASDGRLRLDGLPTRHVSRPVTIPELLRSLEAYAGVWAISASIVASNEVRALRRAARLTRHGNKAFSTSQWVSLEITGVEIEAGLAALLCHDGEGGFAAASAAARVLHEIAAKQVELRDQAGLEIEGNPLETARALTAFLGGPLRIETDLARTLGIEVAI
ncbi:MAG: hypothetical protein ABUT39_05140 [Acidobacteriota bacterium]